MTPPAASDGATRDAPLDVDPGLAWLRGMRRGDFAAAWRLSDRQLGQPQPQDAFPRPRHLQWLWDGRPIDGRRVLVPALPRFIASDWDPAVEAVSATLRTLASRPPRLRSGAGGRHADA